ncbi:DUF421 domain-containing protein [Salsuginibacillus kocurii]|uniref:DUF421 domain-containing protein n=1 Tax=Salsuginibacillus kocurii TaxID=427078 RepID=UPI000370F0B3|nr:DUF421 domain-containing protein [Salsuginibacillus kocurii]
MVGEMAIVLGRILTILPLLAMVTLFMGKRPVAEMPVFDFLIIITLASVTGADIADPNVSNTLTAFAILMIGLLQKTATILMLKYPAFRRKLSLPPTPVIEYGKLLPENMKKIKYSIDDVTELLREQGYFQPSDIRLALIEGSGKLSIYPFDEKRPLTAEDMGQLPQHTLLTFPVYKDGQFVQETLDSFQLTEQDITEQLEGNFQTTIAQAFYVWMDEQKNLYVSEKGRLPELPTPK